MDVPLASGALVDGRYLLDRRLGDGTFGEVWAARDGRLSGRSVAVKFLKQEHLDRAELVARFDAEADAMALLQHPNVVAVLDRGQWERQRFLVTEFVEGEPLSHWIDRYARAGMPPDVLAVGKLFDGIAAGVEAAHLVRVPGPIVHRDLKPDNVLLRRLASGELVPKVLDFGIAQLGARQSTRTGMLMGTPVYMAPEQAMGQTSAVGPWTDVFALGVILVEALTQQHQLVAHESWWGTALQSASAVREALPTLRADVPAAVWDVAARALSPRGVDRFPDAGAMRRAAQLAFAGQSVSAAAVTVMSATAGASSGALEGTAAERARGELSGRQPVVAATVDSPVDAGTSARASGPRGTVPIHSPDAATLIKPVAKRALASDPGADRAAVPRTPTENFAEPPPSGPTPGLDTIAAAPAPANGRGRGGAYALGALVALAGAGAAAYGLYARGRGGAPRDASSSLRATTLAGAASAPTATRDASAASPSPAATGDARAIVAIATNDAGAAAGEPPGCMVLHGPTVIGGHASVAPTLNMGVLGDRVWLGWVVPPRFTARSPDDVALMELNRDGTVARVIDGEQQSEMRSAERANERDFRVTAVADGANGVRADIDRWARLESGMERVECGPLGSDQLLAPGADGGATSVFLPSYTAMFFCRTIAGPSPFVIGMRSGQAGERTLSDRASIFAARGASLADAHEAWQVPIGARRVMAAPNAMSALRNEAIEGLAVRAVPGHGYAVMFRHRHHLQYGWLGDDLLPRGVLMTMPTLGGEPGKPRLAYNGHELVVVFADRGPQALGARETDSSAGTPYALYASRASPSGVFGPPVRLATAATPEGQSEFAPDVEALPDGGFLVVWSEGPTEARTEGADTQRVLLRRYDLHLVPRGGSAAISGLLSASDPRLMVVGNSFLTAMMPGMGETRGVATVAGECP